MNNNNNDLIKLYNSVFNNIYLKRIILYHLNKFNILSVNIKFNTVSDLQDFKYKEYLKSIRLDCKDRLDEIPENVTQVLLSGCLVNTVPIIPNHIESIEFLDVIDISCLNSLSATLKSKINTLKLKLSESDQNLSNIVLPSVTNLEICGTYSKEIPRDILPPSLKNLTLNCPAKLQDILLPESLTSVIMRKSPLTATTPFLSNISSNLVKLNYIYNTPIENNIIFPNTIQDLFISCSTFNARLPDNLKTLKLFLSSYDYEIKFPPSLEHLLISIIDSREKELFQDYKEVPYNLKSLKLTRETITDKNGFSILPNKLEQFEFLNSYFSQTLQVNQIPSSLTYMDFGSSLFNEIININVLPINLKVLIFGCGYSQIINPLAIPQKLQLLKLPNPDYNHPIKLTPLTHPNTAIAVSSKIDLYYDSSAPNSSQIRVLRLPHTFNLPLSILKLQDKSNLEYFHLGHCFNLPIQLSDLPVNNNIKTLVLGVFKETINLEYFQNLETIVISQFSFPNIITSTTIDTQQNIHYNNYKLKNIIINSNNQYFLINLNINFYQFLKYNKDPFKNNDNSNYN